MHLQSVFHADADDNVEEDEEEEEKQEYECKKKEDEPCKTGKPVHLLVGV